MKTRSWAWVLAGLLVAAAWAQGPADDEALERLEETPVETATSEAPSIAEPSTAEPEQPDPEAATATAEEDPLAAIEAQERESLKAVLDRFEPSEQISEDRSVAFPNDI